MRAESDRLAARSAEIRQLLDRAMDAFAADDLLTARDGFGRVLEVDPDDAEAVAMLRRTEEAIGQRVSSLLEQARVLAEAGQLDEAEEKVGQLAQELAQKGYRQAASYVENAKDRLFSYVRFWLRYGLVSPRVSSMIERMMREIGRRLKRIAFGWSDEGAAKMARIIIKRITSANEWEAYWKERLRITGNVVLVYGGIKAM